MTGLDFKKDFMWLIDYELVIPAGDYKVSGQRLTDREVIRDVTARYEFADSGHVRDTKTGNVFTIQGSNKSDTGEQVRVSLPGAKSDKISLAAVIHILDTGTMPPRTERELSWEGHHFSSRENVRGNIKYVPKFWNQVLGDPEAAPKGEMIYQCRHGIRWRFDFMYRGVKVRHSNKELHAVTEHRNRFMVANSKLFSALALWSPRQTEAIYSILGAPTQEKYDDSTCKNSRDTYPQPPQSTRFDYCCGSAGSLQGPVAYPQDHYAAANRGQHRE